MLNWAVRYFPIVRLLRANVPEGKSILEVGCGSYGLAEFYQHKFVGCDVSFPATPKQPMLPVMGSATQLPFKDASFAAVILSDVLEHIPPQQRHRAIAEALRVGRTLAVFGFPSGSLASNSDRRLLADYQRLEIPVPDWLEEHLRYPYPDKDLFSEVQSEWELDSFSNEPLSLHYWMSRREMYGRWNRLFKFLLRIAPGLVERVLRAIDGEPAYRQVFILRSRREEKVA